MIKLWSPALMLGVLTIGVVAFLSHNARAGSATNSFGEYYPHTRWIDVETNSIVVDAYTDRLVVSEQGKVPVTIRGIWKGRSFLRSADLKAGSGYFGVAHEGADGAFFGDARLKKFSFKRVRPDPK